jgi:hypothetical protein
MIRNKNIINNREVAMSPDDSGIADVLPGEARPPHVPMLLPAVRAPSVPRPRRVGRARIAALAAQGRTTAEIAREVGYSRQHVWRLVRNSRPLHAAMNEADAETDFNATGRLMGVRPVVADELARQAAEGNVRVLLWLADRLKIADVAAPIKTRAEGMASQPAR